MARITSWVFGLAYAFVVLAMTPTAALGQQLGGCVAAYYNFTAAGLVCTDVAFPSPGATSGAVTLHGSIVTQAAASTSGSPGALRPGLFLIGGSGGNDRWEAQANSTQPFLDIAVAAAARGVEVLVYDKRTCGAGKGPCQNQFCAPVEIPGQIPACGPATCPGCVAVFNASLDDFVADAAAAAVFLGARPSVDAGAVAVAGHSQGCDVAPLVPPRVAGAGVAVTHVAALEGTDAPPGTVIAQQTAFQVPTMQSVLAYLRAHNASAATIAVEEATVAAFQCTARTAEAQFLLAANGAVTGFSNAALQLPAYVCPFGGVVTATLYAELVPLLGAAALGALGITGPNQAFCPGDVVTGAGPGACVCTAAAMARNATCAAACKVATAVNAANGPGGNQVGFVRSWHRNAEEQAAAWRALPTGTRVFATSSWTDSKIPRANFASEHVNLGNAGRLQRGQFPFTPAAPPVYSLGAASVTVVNFANITHSMFDVSDSCPAAGPPCRVRADVLANLVGWLCDLPGSLPCGPPPAAAAEASTKKVAALEARVRELERQLKKATRWSSR